MGRQDNIITALDIGTHTTRAVIARVQDRGIRICGVGEEASAGIRKSMILDPSAVVPVIRAAIEAAEKEASCEVHEVYTGISGQHIHSFRGNGVKPVQAPDDIVHEHDIEGLQETLRNAYQERGRATLHVIPQEYRLDGSSSSHNPLGCTASRIEMTAHMISADSKIMQNHCHVINDAGFKVLHVCFNGIADGRCVLTEEEKKEGVLLLNIGAGTCTYAVYFNNTVIYSNVFAVGGDNITNDMSLGLQLSIQDAENLKCSYMRQKTHHDTRAETNSIQCTGTDGVAHTILRADIEMIMESRIEETLKYIADDIDEAQVRPLMGRGVVVAGGGVRTYCFMEMAEKIFGTRIRVAHPLISRPGTTNESMAYISETHEYVAETTYTTVMGLLRYAARFHTDSSTPKKSIFRSLFSRSQ